MDSSDFEKITLDRLNEYYEDALEIAELIFRQEYVNDLRGLDRQFSSLLINMEYVFENVVVRGIDTVVGSNRYDVRTNGFGSLVSTLDGDSKLNLEPDFFIWDRNLREVILVGDAKWKTHTDPKREDLYQIAAYQAKYGVPGLLVYPDLSGRIEQSLVYDETKGTAAGRGPLTAIELQTSDNRNYERFKKTVQDTIRSALSIHLPPV